MSMFSNRVKELLEQKKLTQKDLSRLSNVAEASLCRYMKGETKPRIDVVHNIAKALGVSEAYLLGETDEYIVENPKVVIRDILARNKNIITDKDRSEIINMLYGRFDDK